MTQQSDNLSLKAGVSKVNITPPVGIPQRGYASRKDVSQGIHDELYAKALVFDNGLEKIAIITTDTIGVSRKHTRRIRALIEEKTGIPSENVLICASHTHSGPSLSRVWYLPGELGAEDASYIDVFCRKLAGAVQMANNSLTEARIGIGIGEIREGIGSNRRIRIDDRKTKSVARNEAISEANRVQIRPLGNMDIPLGEMDNSVNVLKVEDLQGNIRAVLMNYTCHATAAGAPLLISADYPGYTQQMMENVLDGAVALFAQGACGNVNPNQYRRFEPPSFEDTERMGKLLAAEVLKVVELIEIEAGASVMWSKLGTPLLPIRAEALSEEIANQSFKGLKEAKIDDIQGDMVETEIQAMRIGNAFLVALPGEPFAEIGLSIKKNIQSHDESVKAVFVIGYANDIEMAYIPIAKAYDEGGYEPSSTILAKGAGEILRDKFRDYSTWFTK